MYLMVCYGLYGMASLHNGEGTRVLCFKLPSRAFWMSCVATCTSTALSTSSKSTTSTAVMRLRASATRAFWPPEMLMPFLNCYGYGYVRGKESWPEIWLESKAFKTVEEVKLCKMM